MKIAGILLVGLLAGSFHLSGQAPPGMPLPPGGPGFGRGPGLMGLGGHLGKVVTALPYSADVNTSMSQTLADGNTINRQTTGHIARDSQGRVYFEQNISGGPWAQKGATTITFLSDPVGGYTYVLNASTKTAVRREFREGSGDSSHRRSGPSATGDQRQQAESDLGQQTINGLLATGKSVTRTIPAGTIGNSQAIVEKSETWTSPDLQVVLLSKRTDPRFGVSTYSLTNIRRGEPAAALFQVPSDYKIEDAPVPEFRR